MHKTDMLIFNWISEIRDFGKKIYDICFMINYFWGACPPPDHGIVTHWVDGGGGVPRDAQWKAVVVGFSCGIVINPCVVPVRKAKWRVNVEHTHTKTEANGWLAKNVHWWWEIY